VIRTVGVLGAGTMGAQIAAHVANAGLPALLLDLTAAVAREGLERARRLRPDPFFTPDAARLVSVGGFDTDLDRLAACDWIIEAIVERLDVKQALLARVEPHRRPNAIVSSNTSGIPIAAIGDGRSPEFCAHFLGTHFFNPPRYLRLLELIPAAATDPAVVTTIARFADLRLGKGVVIARDTPNFIANHLALHGVVRILEALVDGSFTIEEIDAMTGPAIGRPKSATFRTLDLGGLDVLVHVADNLAGRLEGDAERRLFELPPFVRDMVSRGWSGVKTGVGFYRRQSDQRSDLFTLDPATMTHRPYAAARLPALDAARGIEDTASRIRALFLGADRVGQFLRRTLGVSLVYAARVAREIAHSIDDVDRAMRWGFGWELGPFELWDAIGARRVIESCGVTDVPPVVADLLASGRERFRDGVLPPAGPHLQIMRAARDRSKVVRQNPGASLVDLGDGVLAVEFHSKMNAIGADAVQMLVAGVKEAGDNFQALVVGNEAANFSAGANLMLLLLEAQEENWDEIDLMIRAFQQTNLGLRYADVPVVVAPAGLALGGGCEIALHGDRIQAAAESYIGFVEVGVGLVPAGAGTKEMTVRAAEAIPPGTADVLPWFQRAFETIGFSRVSTSAPDARRLGLLRDVDGVTMNVERLIADAKDRALARVREGYRPPPRRPAIRVGGESILAPLTLGVHLAWRAGRISDHDALVGRKLAHIIAGGRLPHPTDVSEQYLLDLEREAFLSLCGEPKTQARMAHTLKTGKPLRN
jgi:3-hydroxyacyl-CoA dehydrogenase